MIQGLGVCHYTWKHHNSFLLRSVPSCHRLPPAAGEKVQRALSSLHPSLAHVPALNRKKKQLARPCLSTLCCASSSSDLGSEPNLELNLWNFGTASDDCFIGLTLALNPTAPNLEKVRKSQGTK